MKDTKRRYELFSFMDYTGIAAHLSEMAGKGWLVEKLSNFGWTYRKMEPKKMTFYISYFPKVSEFDPKPTEAYRLYWSYRHFLDIYLLCYERRIVEITFGWEPTAEQIEIAAEGLAGE